MLKSAEKGTEKFFTTTPELNYRGGAFSFASPLPNVPPPLTPTPSSTPARPDGESTSESGPGTSTPTATNIDFNAERMTFAELAQKSPSKPRAKPTARSIRSAEQGEKVCARCKIQHESPEDDALGSLWVGCEGETNERECTYWVHACCLGFSKLTDENLIDVHWYCDDHNESKELIKTMKEKKREALKLQGKLRRR